MVQKWKWTKTGKNVLTTYICRGKGLDSITYKDILSDL